MLWLRASGKTTYCENIFSSYWLCNACMNIESLSLLTWFRFLFLFGLKMPCYLGGYPVMRWNRLFTYSFIYWLQYPLCVKTYFHCFLFKPLDCSIRSKQVKTLFNSVRKFIPSNYEVLQRPSATLCRKGLSDLTLYCYSCCYFL